MGEIESIFHYSNMLKKYADDNHYSFCKKMEEETLDEG